MDCSGCRSQAIRLLAHKGNHRSVALAHEAAKELVAFEPGSSIEALTQRGWGPGELGTYSERSMGGVDGSEIVHTQARVWLATD